MRGLILGLWLVCCAITADGQEFPGLAVLPDGGFAPRGASFCVTLHFAEMDLVPSPAKEPTRVLAPGEASVPASEWLGAHGASARLDLCCVKCPLGLSEVLLGAARLCLANPTD